MSATLVQELFDKGIVTKRHPTLLDVGELQQADDCVYRKFDPAIYRQPGRTEYNSSAVGTKIKGLTHLAFDEGDDMLVAYSGADLYSSALTTITGSFSKIQGVGTLQDVGNETLNTVHFGNGYYLLPSGDRPRRIAYLSAPSLTVATATVSGSTTLTTTVAHGFASVVVGQSLSATNGTGSIGAGAVVTFKTSDLSVEISGSNTNGTVTNVVFAAAQIPSARIMGLDPVDKFEASQIVVQNSQSWNAFLGNGYYYFLITEMYIPGQVDDYDNGFMESGFVTKPQSAHITSYATQSITVTYGGATFPYVNVGTLNRVYATHWQVYMSDKQNDTSTTPSLATFKRVGSPIPIPQSGSPPAATTVTLADTVSTRGPYSPTSSTTYAGLPIFNDAASGYKPHDGSGSHGGMWSTANDAAIALRTFGMDTSAATVTGLTVKVYGGSGTLSKAHGQIIVRRQDGTKSSSIFGEFICNPGLGQTFTFGGTFDQLGETWVVGDFTDGNFELIIHKLGSAHTTELIVDGVEFFIHTTGTSINRDGVSFRTVTYRSQIGTTVTDSTNLPPPIASTGAVFQGSVVLNSVGSPNRLVFSLPGVGEAFPKPYFLVFQNKRKNLITNIQTVGQVLIVGMRDSIIRVNYLPTELDTDFQQGLAHEDLATDHGCVGPRAAALFDMTTGGGPIMAYVSYKGIHRTNGIDTEYLNLDLDWENTVDITNLGTCELRNYPQENWLVLFYPPAGTTHGKNTRALIFPYSPDKIKDGGYLPAIGPFKVSARSAETVYIAGRSYLMTGHQATGKVYVEDQGLTLPGSYTVANSSGSEAAIVISPYIKTRRMYGSGVSRQSREQRIYVMCDAAGATASVTANCTSGASTLTNVSTIASLAVGQLITGTCFQPDTIITSLPGGNTATISKPTISAGTATTVAVSTGTLGVIAYGQDTNAALAAITAYGYQSTLTGGLIVYHLDSLKESHEFVISRVQLPDLTQVQVDVTMRLHHFSYLASDMGLESHRA